MTVVVDFGTLDGGMETRCAFEPVTSGFDALERAGFAIDVIQGGFVCRINGKPADDPCTHTPSASYYWAYWLASEPGGAWTYSDMGASRDPAPGSVDGWAFSDGCTRQPGAPTTCSSGTTTTSTSTTAPARGSGGSTTTAASGSGSTTTTRGGTGSDSSTTTTTEAGESSVSDEAAAPDGEGSDHEVAFSGGQRRAATGQDSPDRGSPVGTLIGASAVAVLGLGALARSRRRRAHGSGSDAG